MDAENEPIQEEEDLGSSSDDDSDSEDVAGGGNPDGGNQDENMEADEEDEDDSDDDEDENDEELLAQLSDTNYKLSGDPFSYDLYVQKIQLLSRLGDAEALRDTREKLSQLYPLNEKLWMDWLHDEISVSEPEAEERQRISDLFDRAVKDYLSIDIWLEYVQFKLGDMNSENGVETCRNLFERALSCGGLHVPMGGLLWDMYREFEGAVLAITAPSRLEEQEQRYIAICKRQLAVPLQGMESTYKQLKSKIDIDNTTEANYKSAVEKLKSIQSFEDKLADENIQSNVETYKEYLEAEKTAKSNPARRICLYERAVANCPLDSSLWLDFYEYTVGIHLEEMSTEVIVRASRNSPWSTSIWTNYLCHVEQHGGSQGEIKEIFEKAVLYCATGEQAGSLWFKYLEILRRRINLSQPIEEDIQLFNKTLAAADQHLRQLIVEPNEFICQLLLFQVRTKVHVTKTVESARDLWLDIYNRGYGSQFNVWLHGLNLEKEYGSGIKDLRKKYEKGLASVKDYPNLVMDLWLNFERDYGDIKSLRYCESKIEKWVKKSQEEQEKTQSETINKFSSNKRREGLGFKRQQHDRNAQVPEKRTKYDSSEKRNLPPPKKSDRVDGPEFKVPFPVSNLPSKVNNRNDNRTSSTPSTSSKKDKEYESEEWKIDKNDGKTVFISNLDAATDEAALREFFSSSGEVENVKIAKNFKGVSKKFGYVGFYSQDIAQKALKRDREALAGRPIFISKCNPDKSSRTAPLNFKSGFERDKLFVKGISPTTKVEDLRALFEQYAKVKDCRLVTYRTGESKGLAYVDFFDHEGARLALSKTDGLEFQQATLTVAFSNPPRKPNLAEEEFAGPSVRRAPTMFIPRAVQVSQKPPETTAANSRENKTPMSNQDFRKLFQK